MFPAFFPPINSISLFIAPAVFIWYRLGVSLLDGASLLRPFPVLPPLPFPLAPLSPLFPLFPFNAAIDCVSEGNISPVKGVKFAVGPIFGVCILPVSVCDKASVPSVWSEAPEDVIGCDVDVEVVIGCDGMCDVGARRCAKKLSVCIPSSEVVIGGPFRVSCSCLLRASERWCAMESFSLSISRRSFSRDDVLFSCIFLLKMIHNYVTKNDAPEDDEHSKLLPSWPFRMLSVGSSGCGKSTVMGNMLMNKELKLPFDRVFVISTTLHQPIYQVMMKHFAGIDETIRSELERELKKKKVSEEKIDETLEALKPTAEFFDSVDEFDVEDLDPNQKNLVLLDDIVMEKKQREFIDL